MVLNSSVSKLWNSRDKLLKEFIGNSLNSRIEIDAETWSEHGGPRLSMEARQRLEICRGVVAIIYLTSPKWSCQTKLVVRNLTILEG